MATAFPSFMPAASRPLVVELEILDVGVTRFDDAILRLGFGEAVGTFDRRSAFWSEGVATAGVSPSGLGVGVAVCANTEVCRKRDYSSGDKQILHEGSPYLDRE